MKKNISDEKLDEMLKNVYNSKVSENFEFKINSVPDKEEYNPEITVSGSEKHIKKTFRPSKLAAIAAAAFIIVSIGTYNLSENSGFSAPSTQISDIPVENVGTSLFDEYLEEFEYEINNFDYECIKVTPNAEPNSYEESQNYIYSDIYHDMKIIPAYENCSFIDTDGQKPSFPVTDEEFYCYIKKIDVPISENEATKFYTRQSYLVWKDADGNITKIRPSAEKVTAEELENKLDCNYDIDIPQKVDSLLNDLSDESKEVYIDDILVRPAVAEENRNGEPEVSIAYDYYVYVNINGQLVPVDVETMWYNSTSIMEFDDSYKATENIPFFDGQLDDGHVILKKTFFWDCSGNEPVDISSYIEELNENYWLETAERSANAEPAETSAEYVTESVETTENTDTTSEIENQVIDKEYILNHMLNSIDFFETAEGAFTTYNTGYNTETEFNVSFAVNYSDNISERFAFEKYSNADGSYSGEYFRMNRFTYSDTNGDVYYNYSEIEINDYIPASERMDNTKPGMDAWIYRDDMTERITNYGKECFMYQELAFSKLYDTSLWEITGEINMLGYNGIMIEGNTESGNKFAIVVEKNTGIILDYEEFTGGALTSYIHVNNLSIDNGLSVNQTELKELYSRKIQEETLNNESFCFTDLADMDEESINALIEKYGDALQRTDNGFTLCSYCLEQNGYNLSDIKLYGNCDFTMTVDEFYNAADTLNKLCAGVCCDIPGLGICEAVITPAENHQYPDYKYENYKVEICEDNYLLKVHFPNPAANVSDDEKEMNEKFHNCPWAELIIE